MKKSLLLLSFIGFGPMKLIAQNLAWAEKSAPVQRETYAISFSHDGQKVFSGSECGPTYLRIFDAFTGQQLWQTQVDSPLMCAQGVKFNSNGSKVATLEELGNLLIYDFTSMPPALLSQVELGTTYSFALAFSPDGNKLATACSNKKLLIHNANNGNEIHSIDAHTNWVTGVDWSTQEQIVTCGDDVLVKLWDSSGNHLRTMSGHTSALSCVKFTPDGNYILSAGKDKTIRIWETATGNLVRILNGHTSEIKQIDVSEDGKLAVSGSFDETIKVWDIASGNQLHSFKKDGAGRVFSVDFMPNFTRYVAAGTSNGDVQVWDMLFGTLVSDTKLPELSIYPNPNNGMFTLNLPTTEETQILISNVSGQVVYRNTVSGTQKVSIDLSGKAQGIYMIQVVTGTDTYHAKVNIQQ